jgi:hypothetical protein
MSTVRAHRDIENEVTEDICLYHAQHKLAIVCTKLSIAGIVAIYILVGNPACSCGILK